jgi:cytochrome b561
MSFTPSTVDNSRYSTVAIGLHWLIVLAIFIQVGGGWYMGELERSAFKSQIEGLHISAGLTILVLTLARIAWALGHKRPPLPSTISTLQRNLATIVQLLFYVLLLAIPLTGWFMESMGTRPVPFFGLEWPHFPGVDSILAGVTNRRPVKEAIETVHGSRLVWLMIALLILHVVGALKHQFDGSPILWRMAPWMKRPS